MSSCLNFQGNHSIHYHFEQKLRHWQKRYKLIIWQRYRRVFLPTVQRVVADVPVLNLLGLTLNDLRLLALFVCSIFSACLMWEWVQDGFPGWSTAAKSPSFHSPRERWTLPSWGNTKDQRLPLWPLTLGIRRWSHISNY